MIAKQINYFYQKIDNAVIEQEYFCTFYGKIILFAAVVLVRLSKIDVYSHTHKTIYYHNEHCFLLL